MNNISTMINAFFSLTLYKQTIKIFGSIAGTYAFLRFKAKTTRYLKIRGYFTDVGIFK